jgi:hypothetical protein
LPAPIAPLDGEPMRTLRDIGEYMHAIGARFERRAWQRAAELAIEAAERGGPLEPVRRQSAHRLLLDRRLDVTATELAE